MSSELRMIGYLLEIGLEAARCCLSGELFRLFIQFRKPDAEYGSIISIRGLNFQEVVPFLDGFDSQTIKSYLDGDHI